MSVPAAEPAAKSLDQPDLPARSSASPAPERTPQPVVPPTWDDPFVAGSSTVVGGPLGRHARLGASWWTPVRVLLAITLLTCAFGFVTKQPCRDAGWRNPQQMTDLCYSDVPLLYATRGLDRGAVPYYTHPSGSQAVEYPVLTGLVMWATAELAHGHGDPREQARWYFDANALLGAAAAAAAVWATAATAGRRRPWDAALFAAAVPLALAYPINWDLWAVLLLALAMLAWARGRPVWTGVLVGLGTATKLYPVLLLGPLLLVGIRAGRLRQVGTAALAAAAAWLAVNVPVAVTSGDGWRTFWLMSRDRVAYFGSVWLILDQRGHGLTADQLNKVVLALFVLACAAIAALALRAPRRPRVAQLMFLVVAAFILVNKVYSPQYVLWLLPLAALARPRWRDVLIWQACEVVHFVGTWLFIAGYTAPNRSLPTGLYQLAILVHVAGLLWLVAMVVRDVLQPWCDPVRADGIDDDPGGGVVDGAPDVLVIGPALRPQRPAAASSGAEPALP